MTGIDPVRTIGSDSGHHMAQEIPDELAAELASLLGV